MTSDALSIRPVWITDPHLDHLDKDDPECLNRLGPALDRLGASHILLGGDIAESRTLESRLKAFAAAACRPVYFVPGNHDYYFSSIAEVRHMISGLTIPGVTSLSTAGVVDLGGGTALAGRGGWGDARRGDLRDFVILTDYAAIGELAQTIDHEDFWVNGFRRRGKLIRRLRELGDEEAADLERDVRAAAEVFPRVIVLTHVPVFTENCIHPDGHADERGYPGFLWDAMGSRLIRMADEFPGTEFLVFSGHIHAPSRAEIAPNLRGWTSGAMYGELRIRPILTEARWCPGEELLV